MSSGKGQIQGFAIMTKQSLVRYLIVTFQQLYHILRHPDQDKASGTHTHGPISEK